MSVYVPGTVEHATEPAQAHQRSFMTASGAGDRSAQSSGAGFSSVTTAPLSRGARPFVSELQVRASRQEGALVAIGDSINEGIGGNRVLRDGFIPVGGPSLLHRLHADVLARHDVTDVILLEGTNDIGLPPPASAGEVIGGLERAVRRLKAARRRGPRRRLNVLVGTITPRAGGIDTTAEEINAKRNAINRWIRMSGIGDGVVDFDRALRDPSDPSRLAPSYDSGDHLHPSSVGYQRMARAVRLSRLKGPQCRGRRARSVPRFSG